MNLRRKLAICSILIVFTIYILVSYSSKDNSKIQTVEFYLVDQLKLYECKKLGINQLPLKSEPVIAEKDIQNYNWEKHELILTKKIFDENIELDGRPFVLLVNNKRIYLGTFWSLESSRYMPAIPIINIPAQDEKTNTYKIEYTAKNNDPRNNKNLYNALKSNNKLIG